MKRHCFRRKRRRQQKPPGRIPVNLRSYGSDMRIRHQTALQPNQAFRIDDGIGVQQKDHIRCIPGKDLVTGRAKAAVFRIDDQRNTRRKAVTQNTRLGCIHRIVHHNDMDRAERIGSNNRSCSIETHPGGMVVDDDDKGDRTLWTLDVRHDLDFVGTH